MFDAVKKNVHRHPLYNGLFLLSTIVRKTYYVSLIYFGFLIINNFKCFSFHQLKTTNSKLQ